MDSSVELDLQNHLAAEFAFVFGFMGVMALACIALRVWVTIRNRKRAGGRYQ